VRLNLGCGSRTAEGYVNVDVVQLPKVDVVHDLDVIPWPWPDGSAEQIVGQDVFEHVANPIGFMTEAHRVLMLGGVLILKSPHWKHQDAYTDPTHKRFCTEHTWDYWIRGTVLFNDHNPAYGGAMFTLGGREVVSGAIFIHLHKI
jgi:predicted SAM-dependent methyltransferase